MYRTIIIILLRKPLVERSISYCVPIIESFYCSLSYLYRAELQIATTQDYATDSWFWTVFTGALNHQTAHHLFPGVIQSHYRKITPIVVQACKDFGIKYHYVDTTKEALACHIEHLRKLGQTSASDEAPTISTGAIPGDKKKQ